MNEQDQPYYLIKAATRRLIKAAGGIDEATHACRVGKSNLSDYQNINKPDLFMPLDVASDLERETGSHAITEAMARLAGGMFLSLSQGDKVNCLPSHLPNVLKEVGDVISGIGKNMGTMAPMKRDERQLLSNEIDEAIRSLVVARNLLDGVTE